MAVPIPRPRPARAPMDIRPQLAPTPMQQGAAQQAQSGGNLFGDLWGAANRAYEAPLGQLGLSLLLAPTRRAQGAAVTGAAEYAGERAENRKTREQRQREFEEEARLQERRIGVQEGNLGLRRRELEEALKARRAEREARERSGEMRARLADRIAQDLNINPQTARVIAQDPGGFDTLFEAWTESKVKSGQPGVDQFGFEVGSAKSRRANRLLSQGMDPERIPRMVDGDIVQVQNPTTGDTRFIDRTKAPMNEDLFSQDMAENEGLLSPRREVDRGRGLYDMVEYATGVSASTRRALDSTVGQASEVLFGTDFGQFPEANQANRAFNLAERNVRQALALNQRYPVAEMAQLDGLLPRGPTVRPGDLRDAIVQLDGYLAEMERLALGVVNDRNSPIDARQQARTDIQQIRTLRRQLGVPQGRDQSGGASSGGASTGGGEVIDLGVID